MPRITFNQLLESGAHFGHLKRKWNPEMAPYIFMEKNGIHIIDLHKTVVKIEESANALKQIAKSGRKVLFVATKKQAKTIVAEKIKEINMPFITERWSGGMLTNFPTIRKAIKKMTSIDRMMSDNSFENLSKREKLQITRQRTKMQKVLGSIADLTRLPAALFVVDVMKEKIAVREAKRLHIPVFGIVDTNSDPNIDFVIPANDDATKSIALVIDVVVTAIKEGLEERKAEKDKEDASTEKRQSKKESKTAKSKARKSRKGKKTLITDEDMEQDILTSPRNVVIDDDDLEQTDDTDDFADDDFVEEDDLADDDFAEDFDDDDIYEDIDEEEIIDIDEDIDEDAIDESDIFEDEDLDDDTFR
jgi:small subunit ribosomal protein S2